MTFAYPKSSHERTEAPPLYSNYRQFKPHLRAEFKGRCVYCRTPEGPRCAFDEYGVDHYRPKSLSQFKHLARVCSNLFYCCAACNRRKGPYWPTIDKEAKEFIPNPCDHVMFEHLTYRNGEVVAKTEAGRKACEVLDLNNGRFVTWRRGILDTLSVLEAQVGTLTRQLLAAETKIATGEFLPVGTVAQVRTAIDNAKASLSFLRGE